MNRRQFLGGAGAALALAGVAGAGSAPHPGPVRFGLIGCGGRGVYDAAGLVTQAGAQVVALADLFEDKLGPAKARLDEVLKQKGMPPIAPDRLYRGWQSGPRLAQGDVDAVLLALPAYFYPDMLEAVAETGKHIYCEKPVGVDVPGCLRVIEVAKKLEGKVVFHVGMQVPWSSAMREMARRIHSGAIGDIVTGQSFFYFGSIGHQPPPGAGPDEARIRKWVCDRVLSGDIVVEQNVHGIDKVNWILKGHPVSAFAKASRKARKDFGDIRDNFVGEMTYPNEIVVNFQSTQFIKGYSDAGERFYGTKGVSESHYTGGVKIYGEEPWDAGVNDIIADAETNKYRAFVDDIRSGNLRNEGFRGAESTLSAILVRTAADRGREVTWDEMLASGEKLESGIDLKQFG